MKMKPIPARNFTLLLSLSSLVVISLALAFDCFGQLSPKSRAQSREARTRAAEQLAIGNGWEKLTVTVNGASRQLLWKGPARWKKGAIIVMHGGSGAAVDWCHAPKTGNAMIDQTLKAQVDFSHDAIASGFAVFSLESSDDLVKDDNGLPQGKRFDCAAVEDHKNVDLPFIEKVIREVIPSKRPNGTSPSVFMTGESTGGCMTALAATNFDEMITAFAPGAAFDPYGTYFDASVDTGREARGVAIDRETGQRITETGSGGSATAASYPKEKTWASMKPPTKPPFMGLHHEDDGIVDISCHVKLVKQLREHGYPMATDLVLKGTGKKNIAAHLWQSDYNAPELRFFAKHSAAPGDQ